MSEQEPRFVSRRSFLSRAGLAASIVVAGRVVDVFAPAGAATNPGPKAKPKFRLASPTRTLVVVELGGGNDGLNTLVPYTDPGYRKLRPTLAVDAPIDLDGTVGLAPELATVAARYKAGQVAIVEGVGYPDPDLSHFASLATWWSAAPAQPTTTGWLGRFLDETIGFEDPLAGIVIGAAPSPALLGAASFSTTVADADGLQPRLPPWLTSRDAVLDAWPRFAPAKLGRSKLLVGRVADAIHLTADARTDLAADLAGYQAPAAPGATSAGDRRGPYDGSLAADLALAAQLVAAKDPPRVIYLAGTGDYDTHQGQAARHAQLLQDLDAGIAAFLTAVEKANVADRAVLMTTSEFGRRPAENGSGTDHGTAGVHFVIGSSVAGGRHGTPSSLAKLDARGNLVFATDFRAYFATVLAHWLGTDPEPILGKGFAPLSFLH